MSNMNGLKQLKLELFIAVAFYQQTHESQYKRMIYEALDAIADIYGFDGLKTLLFEAVEAAINDYI